MQTIVQSILVSLNYPMRLLMNRNVVLCFVFALHELWSHASCRTRVEVLLHLKLKKRRKA